jgi:hypothetical protein
MAKLLEGLGEREGLLVLSVEDRLGERERLLFGGVLLIDECE